MKLIVTFCVIVVVIFAMIIRAEDLFKDENFDVDDVIDYAGDVPIAKLICTENAVDEFAKTLPAVLQDDFTIFRNTLQYNYDEYHRCQALPYPIDATTCRTDLRQKFADDLNNLLDEVNETGVLRSFILITDLKITIENCITA